MKLFARLGETCHEKIYVKNDFYIVIPSDLLTPKLHVSRVISLPNLKFLRLSDILVNRRHGLTGERGGREVRLMCVETWSVDETTTSTAVSAAAVSGLVLLLITAVMTTVLALAWRRYRIKARQRRFSQLSCTCVTYIIITHELYNKKLGYC